MWATELHPLMMGILVSAIVGIALTLPISSAAICAGLGLTGLAVEAAINSGMGTCGLCGPIGVWTGWVTPSAAAVANGASAMVPAAMDWTGLALVAVVLPAVICAILGFLLRKAGWIKDGDLAL